jgi:hypothetical protein
VADGVNGDPLSLFAQSRIGRHHLKAAVGAVTTTDVLVELARSFVSLLNRRINWNPSDDRRRDLGACSGAVDGHEP